MKRLVPATVALFGLLLLPAVLVSDSAAQRNGSAHAGSLGHFSGQRFNSPAGSFAVRQNAYSSRFRRSSPYSSLPFAFFADAFNPDDIYSTGYPVASEPPEYLLQAARAFAGSSDHDSRAGNGREAAAAPLMIELQGGKYVHVNGSPVDGEALPLNLGSTDIPAPKLSGRTSTAAPVAQEARRELPAVLIFRDGHSEEVRDYAIAEGKLYARGDYYTDGYWNKTIDLASLNVPQTLQENLSRNVKFVLPSSPNEVVTRP
jgi:hypothetical protein